MADSRLKSHAHPAHCSRRERFHDHFKGCLCVLLAIYIFLLTSTSVASQVISTNFTYTLENSVRREGVDSSLRNYAILALSQATTGTIYNVTLPPVLSGIKAQAIQLRSDSLEKQGQIFNEFSIPKGAVLGSNSSLLMMIYRKIFNFTVYSLPSQYQFGGPVVGIINYAPSNFTTNDPTIPELSVTFPNRSISVRVPLFSSLGQTVPFCAYFSANGTVTLDNVTSSPNVCTLATLGDVALVLPASDPPAQQSSPTAPVSLQSPIPVKKAARKWKLAVEATFLALVGLAFCVALAFMSAGLVGRIKVAIMDRLEYNEEALQTSLIGTSRAPTAANVRTKPALEVDMARFGD